MAGLILKAPYYSPRSTPKNGGTRGGYAEYISTREGVEVLPRGGMADYVGERRGSNGLFSDEGVPIVLAKVKLRNIHRSTRSTFYHKGIDSTLYFTRETTVLV